jgi:hypothetical protein
MLLAITKLTSETAAEVRNAISNIDVFPARETTNIPNKAKARSHTTFVMSKQPGDTTAKLGGSNEEGSEGYCRRTPREWISLHWIFCPHTRRSLDEGRLLSHLG